MNEEAPTPEKLTVVRLKDKELVDQLCHRARQGVLTWLRERSEHVFWHGSDSEVLGYFSLGRFLGISRRERLNLQSVAKVLTHHSPVSFRTFVAHWSGGEGSNPRVQVCPTDTAEWTDVLNEAWEGIERPPHNLSEPGDKLLKWAQQPKNQDSWIHRATIGRQAQLRGTSWTADFLAGVFKEIQRKADIGLKVEQKEDEFRLSFE